MNTRRADWGYIEGYFGRLLDWSQRLLLLDRLAAGNLGTWVYAPKEDAHHRRKWREAYDDRWCEGFAAFCEAAKARDVRVVAAVSPGLDIRYGDASDEQLLQDKFAQMLRLGATGLGLFFDDLPLPAHRADEALARQQVAVLQRLWRNLPVEPENLWFCPTQYCDFLAGGDIATSSYLRAVAELPPQVRVLWTGRHVISPRMDEASLQPTRALLRRPPALWDNFYANDYAPRRLILSPYRHRSRTHPLLLNPTGMPHTDALYLDLLARHSAGVPAEQAFAQALAEQGVPQTLIELIELAPWLFGLGDSGDGGDSDGEGAENPQGHTAAEVSEQQLQQWADALYELAFGEWSSPLHREWYPWLQGTRQDIKYLMRSEAGGIPDSLLRSMPPLLRRLFAAKRQV